MSLKLLLGYLGLLAVMFGFVAGYDALFGDMSWLESSVTALVAFLAVVLSKWFFGRRRRISAHE